MHSLHTVLATVQQARCDGIWRRIPLALVFWGVFLLASLLRQRRRVQARSQRPRHSRL